MQALNFTKFLMLFLVSVLLTACETKTSTEQKATQETEQATAVKPVSYAVGLDAHPGKTLHDANCISCHDAKVYTRVERKVLDYTQLAAQVRRCDANLGSRLFDEDLAQITDYLNQAYYKYPK